MSTPMSRQRETLNGQGSGSDSWGALCDGLRHPPCRLCPGPAGLSSVPCTELRFSPWPAQRTRYLKCQTGCCKHHSIQRPMAIGLRRAECSMCERNSHHDGSCQENMHPSNPEPHPPRSKLNIFKWGDISLQNCTPLL